MTYSMKSDKKILQRLLDSIARLELEFPMDDDWTDSLREAITLCWVLGIKLPADLNNLHDFAQELKCLIDHQK